MRRMRENYDYIEVNPDQNNGMKYMLVIPILYWSPRYRKHVQCKAGMVSDGATGAVDLADSISWWVHDQICNTACWADGTRLSNWQASRVLRDILSAEDRKVRKRTWFWGTFFLGGWGIKAKSGWFFARNK